MIACRIESDALVDHFNVCIHGCLGAEEFFIHPGQHLISSHSVSDCAALCCRSVLKY